MTDLGKIEGITLAAAARRDCDLVQLTYRREREGWVLRALIERRGSDPASGSGVDHALCAEVSREISAALDAEEAVSESFVLEVSSPGVERPLTRPADYARFEGREAKVETKAPVGGRKRFRGVLAGVRGDGVALSLAGGETVNLEFGKISKAHLVFETGGVHSRAGEK